MAIGVREEDSVCPPHPSPRSSDSQRAVVSNDGVARGAPRDKCPLSATADRVSTSASMRIPIPVADNANLARVIHESNPLSELEERHEEQPWMPVSDAEIHNIFATA